MASFQVTSSELKTKASELRQINAQFKSQLANLDDQEGTLIAMWEGEAKEAFNSAFKSDRVQMDNFYNLIEQYCVALENIAAKYNQAEAVNTSTASTRTY
jgi:WXG100 family type VII secretion target